MLVGSFSEQLRPFKAALGQIETTEDLDERKALIHERAPPTMFESPAEDETSEIIKAELDEILVLYQRVIKCVPLVCSSVIAAEFPSQGDFHKYFVTEEFKGKSNIYAIGVFRHYTTEVRKNQKNTASFKPDIVQVPGKSGSVILCSLPDGTIVGEAKGKSFQEVIDLIEPKMKELEEKIQGNLKRLFDEPLDNIGRFPCIKKTPDELMKMGEELMNGYISEVLRELWRYRIFELEATIGALLQYPAVELDLASSFEEKLKQIRVFEEVLLEKIESLDDQLKRLQGILKATVFSTKNVIRMLLNEAVKKQTKVGNTHEAEVKKTMDLIASKIIEISEAMILQWSYIIRAKPESIPKVREIRRFEEIWQGLYFINDFFRNWVVPIKGACISLSDRLTMVLTRERKLREGVKVREFREEEACFAPEEDVAVEVEKKVKEGPFSIERFAKVKAKRKFQGEKNALKIMNELLREMVKPSTSLAYIDKIVSLYYVVEQLLTGCARKTYPDLKTHNLHRLAEYVGGSFNKELIDALDFAEIGSRSIGAFSREDASTALQLIRIAYESHKSGSVQIDLREGFLGMLGDCLNTFFSVDASEIETFFASVPGPVISLDGMGPITESHESLIKIIQEKTDGMAQANLLLYVDRLAEVLHRLEFDRSFIFADVRRGTDLCFHFLETLCGSLLGIEDTRRYQHRFNWMLQDAEKWDGLIEKEQRFLLSLHKERSKARLYLESNILEGALAGGERIRGGQSMRRVRGGAGGACEEEIHVEGSDVADAVALFRSVYDSSMSLAIKLLTI